MSPADRSPAPGPDEPSPPGLACEPRRAIYANTFHVSASAGEVLIHLGHVAGRPTAGQPVRLSQCIAMTPGTAGRLAEALARVLDPHAVSPGRADPENRLIALIGRLGVPCGMEYSFRVSRAGLQPDRFLLSVGPDDLGSTARESVLSVCRELAMPAEFVDVVGQRFDDAAVFHFGFEGDGPADIFKLYLEFASDSSADARRPRLLHLAFKWSPHDPSARVVTSYVCHAGLSVEELTGRIAAMFGPTGEDEPARIACDLLALAAGRVSPEQMLYMEAEEQAGPRHSFDVNLYQASLTMQDIYPLLLRMCRHYGIPESQFAAVYQPARLMSFGHLSGGVHRNGQDYLCVYYGAHPLGNEMVSRPFGLPCFHSADVADNPPLC